jgi:hypothetical protein
MDATPLDISCCQRCRYYTLEGRRGGHCSQLNVPVQGSWQPCSLGAPVFLQPLPDLDAIPIWREEMAVLKVRSQTTEEMPCAPLTP